jgi:small subunit ribosomal protein S20
MAGKKSRPNACGALTWNASGLAFSIHQTSTFFEFFGESGVPRIDSAKKNMRKSRAANIRNRAQRATLRTALKVAKSGSATPEQRAAAVSLLDRAARKGLVHKNAAARHKSRMAKKAAK